MDIAPQYFYRNKAFIIAVSIAGFIGSSGSIIIAILEDDFGLLISAIVVLVISFVLMFYAKNSKEKGKEPKKRKVVGLG